MDCDGARETVLEQYASVARIGPLRCDIAEFVGDSGLYLNYRRVLLPLSKDGVTPNILLGMQKAIGVDGYKIRMPRRM